MVFVPPGAEHTSRNTNSELLVYVSATAPPYAESTAGQRREPRDPGNRQRADDQGTWSSSVQRIVSLREHDAAERPGSRRGPRSRGHDWCPWRPAGWA